MERKKTAAVILAGGKGTRMGGSTLKQYIEIDGYPLIYYSLKAFSESFVDDIVLVCGEGEELYCSNEIVDKYGFTKVRNIVTGGRERYHSVYNALKALRCMAEGDNLEPDEVVFIHDGARPLVDGDVITRAYDAAVSNHAAAVAVPSKDTVKTVDADCFAVETIRRDLVWLMQTPQVFDFYKIYDAYCKLIEQEQQLLERGVLVTDDAMVLELFSDTRVKLVKGDYCNIKVTTPEDIELVKYYLNTRN